MREPKSKFKDLYIKLRLDNQLTDDIMPELYKFYVNKVEASDKQNKNIIDINLFYQLFPIYLQRENQSFFNTMDHYFELTMVFEGEANKSKILKIN